MQRPLLHRLFSIWLALLVLTASVGLTVQQHTCRQSGTHTASVIFSPATHGCPAPVSNAGHQAEKAKAQFTKSCCEFGAHFHKVDAPSAKLAWAKAPVVDTLPHWVTTTFWLTAPTALFRQLAVRWHASDTSPPLRAGRALLAFVGMLIV